MKRPLFRSLCVCAGLAVLTACGPTAPGPGEDPRDLPDPAGPVVIEDDPGMGAPIVGGWSRAASPVVTAELSALLDQALDGFVGSEITPVALLETQVVAGTNYAVLCRLAPAVPDAVATYGIVRLYADLDGGARILDLTDSGVAVSDADGGWSAAGDPTVPEEIRPALDRALERSDGGSYGPVALLSVRPDGTRLFCEMLPAVPDADPAYVLVDLYTGPDGDARIGNVVPFEAAGD